MGGLGPMAGQNHHFRNYAVEKIPYAIDRYVNETNRLYGVLNKRLADREFIAGDYSIADMASYPWVVPYKNQGQEIDDFPHLKRWLETIAQAPGDRARLRQGERGQTEFRPAAIRTDGGARSCCSARPRRWCGRVTLLTRHCRRLDPKQSSSLSTQMRTSGCFVFKLLAMTSRGTGEHLTPRHTSPVAPLLPRRQPLREIAARHQRWRTASLSTSSPRRSAC